MPFLEGLRIPSCFFAALYAAVAALFAAEEILLELSLMPFAIPVATAAPMYSNFDAGFSPLPTKPVPEMPKAEFKAFAAAVARADADELNVSDVALLLMPSSMPSTMPSPANFSLSAFVPLSSVPRAVFSASRTAMNAFVPDVVKFSEVAFSAMPSVMPITMASPYGFVFVLVVPSMPSSVFNVSRAALAAAFADTSMEALSESIPAATSRERSWPTFCASVSSSGGGV